MEFHDFHSQLSLEIMNRKMTLRDFPLPKSVQSGIVGVVSGGFDPVHPGHIAMFKEAAEMTDYLIVGVNSDAWLTRKKGKPFMPLSDRLEVIYNFGMVDNVAWWDDSDGSACELLEGLKEHCAFDSILFCNGGDRGLSDCPETAVENITCVFGIGGDYKMSSSSDYIKEWEELMSPFRKEHYYS